MADDDALAALLAAGDVEAFNDRRTERSRPELFAIDLSHKSLVGIDLSNANLEKGDLTGADLSEANLMKANLGGIDGSGMKLVQALALRARFKEAWMDGADLTAADLTNADFAEANLERSVGPGVKLAQARLRGVKATGVVWPDADLSEAKLQAAVFVGADLQRADLTEAIFADADLTDARLDGAVATNAKFPGAKLVRARLPGARLAGAMLTSADLTGADLSAADLSRANLAGAVLTGATLRGAILADANLEGAKLDGVDLREADLTGLDPTALGLDAATVAGLAASGVQADGDATLVLSAPSLAAGGGQVVAVWDNADGPEKRSVRFGVFRDGRWTHGVVPVSSDGVVDRQVVAVDGRPVIVVTRVRPDGAVAMFYPLTPEGVLDRCRTVPIGYDPLVAPALGARGDRLLYWGLARRGPTLVLHEVVPLSASGELRPVRSDKVATAVAFIEHAPVLACKGGVVVRVAPTGPTPPRRTPDGFPGVKGHVVPFGDDLLAVWAVERLGPVPGGLRMAVLGPRHAPREEILWTTKGRVGALAVVGTETSVTVTWVELGEGGAGDTALWRANLPDPIPELLDGPENIVGLLAAEGVLAALLAGGGLAVLDGTTGRASAVLGGT